MTDTERLVARAQEHLYPNYRQPPVVLSHGSGATLFDTDGKRYIDLYAGIAVSTLGHAHPQLVSAIARQAGKLMHQANYYLSAPNVELAERLCALTGLDRAFFCNSGTEAIEAILKLARRHFYNEGQTERFVVIAFDNSFHGRTLGALAATGQKKYSEGFGPMGGVVHVPYGDLGAVRQQMSDRIAAILVEPIQGEGGVIPAPEGFLKGLRELCDDSGALLLVDEVQTGIGRTGTFLGIEPSGVRPDAVALAKALGSGFPVGAMLCREAYKDALPPGSHGSTFGGNPLASAAALTTLDALRDESLLSRATESGRFVAERLGRMVDRHPAAVAHRGRGLMQGLVMDDRVDVAALVGKLREAGVLVTAAGGVAVRLTPPLTISRDELDEGLTIIDQVIAETPV